MTTYLAKRLVQSVATILGIVTIVFFLLRLAPGDPIALLIPPDLPPGRHQEVVAEIRARYGFDKPVVQQYFTYIWRMLQGDFGSSIRTGAPILAEVSAEKQEIAALRRKYRPSLDTHTHSSRSLATVIVAEGSFGPSGGSHAHFG
jgi:ABC-type microcin C transport system permease subunit YejB